MSLDLTRIAAQVRAMIASLRDSRAERQQKLALARETLVEPPIDLDAVKAKVAAARNTWLVAEILEGLDRRFPAPAPPDDFTVLATDGSHIDVERHRAVRCYLINTGSVVLAYGRNPDAELASTPVLYADEKDLVVTAPDGATYPLDANLLGIKRSLEEWRALVATAASRPAGSTNLALVDGTLIQWGLERQVYPAFVRDVFLQGGFLRSLDEIKRLNADRSLAVASYISYPGGSDVVNTLRVVLCPGDVINDKVCKACTSRECDRIAGVCDRDLFAGLLEPGERSALFQSTSKVLDEYSAEHRICFFYVNVDEEIARVEVPRWVADDAALLDLTHALVLDQCRRGHGYPVALSEAHEQAVVTGADRERFWELVEDSLTEEHLPTPGSAKSRSKRTRWV